MVRVLPHDRDARAGSAARLLARRNLKANTVKVTHKPDRGWTPKAYREREIPIPVRLVESLKAWKARAKKPCELVFPTAGCNPKLDFLDCLKAAAERAELDKDGFWLHKFRATFATWHLWSGVDLRTVQQWLGHSDMESTMRYLKPSREAKTNHVWSIAELLVTHRIATLGG